MKRLEAILTRALDAWSDFAIDCWFWALRFAVLITISGIVAAFKGRWAEGAFERMLDNLPFLGLFVFGMGVLLSIAYRIDRAFAAQRVERGPPIDGGRNRPKKRVQRRQWGNRKRRKKLKGKGR